MGDVYRYNIMKTCTDYNRFVIEVQIDDELFNKIEYGYEFKFTIQSIEITLINAKHEEIFFNDVLIITKSGAYNSIYCKLSHMYIKGCNSKMSFEDIINDMETLDKINFVCNEENAGNVIQVIESYSILSYSNPQSGFLISDNTRFNIIKYDEFPELYQKKVVVI